jgi:predicted benzoate:H+ symporter BenE
LFSFTLEEFSGSLGDLGTFLPHIIGAIAVVGMDPSGILTCFGLFYAFSGLFYRLPMAVQPMKAASAAVLILPMTPGSVAGAGLVIGGFFLVAGMTGLISRIARILPPTIAAGLQLGLGLSLAALGIKMVEGDLWFGLPAGVLMLVLMRWPRIPAALLAIVAGAFVACLVGDVTPLPPFVFGLHLPRMIWPNATDILTGIDYAVLPQIPLTLTNAVIVTATLARQLFPERAGAVTERRLAISTGLANLLAAPFGGYMMCHGAGGMAGHYRFGARTATAPVFIGLVFLALGLLLGDTGYGLLKEIPTGVLGCLLIFSGIELALAAKMQDYKGPELFLVVLVAAIGVATNAAVAFAVGVPVAYGLRRGWLRP